MDVTLTKQYRGKALQTPTYNYPFSKSTASGVEKVADNTSPGIYPDSVIIPFNDTQAPSIEDYDLTYLATFGNYPRVFLVRLLNEELEGDDTESEYELLVVPVRYKEGGVLKRIYWDLPEEMSGKIILTK